MTCWPFFKSTENNENSFLHLSFPSTIRVCPHIGWIQGSHMFDRKEYGRLYRLKNKEHLKKEREKKRLRMLEKGIKITRKRPETREAKRLERETRRRYREKNREKINEYARKWYAKTTAPCLLHARRSCWFCKQRDGMESRV